MTIIFIDSYKFSQSSGQSGGGGGGGGGTLGAPSVLLSETASNPFGTGAFTTGSISTPTSGAIMFVAAAYVTNGGGDPGVDITISDSGGHSWTSIHQSRRVGSGSDHLGLAIFRTSLSSASTFTISVDTTAGSMWRWSVIAWEDTNPNASPIGAADGTVSNTGDGSVSITLDTAPASNSYVFGVLATYDTTDSTAAITADTGWTELAERARSLPNLQVQYRTSSTSTSVSWSDNGTSVSGYLGAAFEVVPA